MAINPGNTACASGMSQKMKAAWDADGTLAIPGGAPASATTSQEHLCYVLSKGVADELDAEGFVPGGGGGGGGVLSLTGNDPIEISGGGGYLAAGLRWDTNTFGVSATKLVAQFGTAAGKICEGNDSRITGAVQSTRTLTAGTGLTGGGDLSADRSFVVAYGTSSGTAAEGNDSRITGAVQTSRSLTAGTGLTGGGDLSTDRTFAVAYGTSAGTSTAGNDARVTGAIQTPGSSAQGDILVRDGSGWTRLAAGTSGYVLKTNGAGANPTWGSLATLGASTVQSEPVASYKATSATSAPEVLGRIQYDPGDWNLTGKSLYFKTVFSSPDAASTATVKIYNATIPGYVTGLSWTTTSATPSEQASSGITGAITNFDPATTALLEVHGSISSTTGVCLHASTFLIAA